MLTLASAVVTDTQIPYDVHKFNVNYAMHGLVIGMH